MTQQMGYTAAPLRAPQCRILSRRWLQSPSTSPCRSTQIKKKLLLLNSVNSFSTGGKQQRATLVGAILTTGAILP